MDNVIWTGCRILKLTLNVEIFIYLFVYSLIKKKYELLTNFHNENTQPYLNLEGTSKCFPQQQKSSIFNANFNIWCPVQMTWSTHKNSKKKQVNKQDFGIRETMWWETHTYFHGVSHSRNIDLIFQYLLVLESEDEVLICNVPAVVSLAVSTYTEKIKLGFFINILII